MKASREELLQLRAYINASQELSSWITGARALALLNGAVELGILSSLRTKSTPEQIASITNKDRQSIVDLCLALQAHGVVMQDGDCFQLTPEFALLESPDAPVPLSDLLGQAMVMRQALQSVAGAETAYTTMPAEDALAMAKGAGISALSTAPHVSPIMIGQVMPEVEALWQAGAFHLEVGCGVGNSLLGIVLTYPKVRAAGIEIDELTHQEAIRRAGVLAVADRVELRRMDACDLRDDGLFDTVQWSQFFFPHASRPIVLQAMHRALKPGGYLLMPWLGSVSSDTVPRRGAMLKMALRMMRLGGVSFVPFLLDALGDTPKRRKKERRFSAIQRVLFSRWGVPVQTVRSLKTEVASAGFKIVRVLHMPSSQFALTRGFLLAQRDGG